MSSSISVSSDSEPISPDFETQPLEQSDAFKDDRVGESGSDQSAKDNSSGEEKVREETEEAEAGEEEKGECGFCVFMKAGGCRDSFVAWETCVEEAEENKEDVVEKCFAVTEALKKCMEAHAEYYEPILNAEKVAEEEAIIELEKDDAVSRSLDQIEDPKDVKDDAKNKNSSNEK